MSGMIIFIILGCGSLGGVLWLGGVWGDCDLDNLKNMCICCLLLIECEMVEGKIIVLIDILFDMCY